MACQEEKCCAAVLVGCRVCQKTWLCARHLQQGCKFCHVVVAGPRLADGITTGIPVSEYDRPGQEHCLYDLTQYHPLRAITLYVPMDADLQSFLGALHRTWLADVYYRAVLAIPPKRSSARLTWRPPAADNRYQQHLTELVEQYNQSGTGTTNLDLGTFVTAPRAGTTLLTVPLVKHNVPFSERWSAFRTPAAVSAGMLKVWSALRYLHCLGIAHTQITADSLFFADDEGHILLFDAKTLDQAVFVGKRSRKLVSDERATTIIKQLHDSLASGNSTAFFQEPGKPAPLSSFWESANGLALLDWCSRKATAQRVDQAFTRFQQHLSTAVPSFGIDEADQMLAHIRDTVAQTPASSLFTLDICMCALMLLTMLCSRAAELDDTLPQLLAELKTEMNYGISVALRKPLSGGVLNVRAVLSSPEPPARAFWLSRARISYNHSIPEAIVIREALGQLVQRTSQDPDDDILIFGDVRNFTLFGYDDMLKRLGITIGGQWDIMPWREPKDDELLDGAVCLVMLIADLCAQAAYLTTPSGWKFDWKGVIQPSVRIAKRSKGEYDYVPLLVFLRDMGEIGDGEPVDARSVLVLRRLFDNEKHPVSKLDPDEEATVEKASGWVLENYATCCRVAEELCKQTNGATNMLFALVAYAEDPKGLSEYRASPEIINRIWDHPWVDKDPGYIGKRLFKEPLTELFEAKATPPVVISIDD